MAREPGDKTDADALAKAVGGTDSSDADALAHAVAPGDSASGTVDG